MCLATCGLLSIGLIKFDTEASPYKLWIPQNADFVINANWLWENFPSDTRYHSVIVTADNVLTPEVLQYVKMSDYNLYLFLPNSFFLFFQVFHIHQKVHRIETPNGKTWKTSCYE